MRDKIPPFGKIQHDLQQHFKNKECLHPQASEESCDSQIIKAHTISRKSTLNEITNQKNKVLTFYPARLENNKPKLYTKGWKQATTFLGFCGKHDNETFSDIEKKPFEVSDKNCFLIGYRALCHEFYMKKASNSASNFQDELVEKQEDPIVKYFMKWQSQQFNKEVEEGYEIVKDLKQEYDFSLENEAFEKFNYVVITFKGELSIVSTGMVTPDFLVNGEKIQDYESDDLQNLFYGIISSNEKHYLVFHWLRKHALVTDYIESILNLKESLLTSFLVQFMFNYVENTFFSEIWWESLAVEVQNYLTNLAFKPFAYGKRLDFKKVDLVKWNNLNIEEKIIHA